MTEASDWNAEIWRWRWGSVLGVVVSTGFSCVVYNPEKPAWTVLAVCCVGMCSGAAFVAWAILRPWEE